MIYENGRQRQNVWTKKSWEVKDTPKESAKPVRLDYKQAKELEKKNLSQLRGLTSGAESGIIKSKRFTPLSGSRVVPVLRKESQQWIASLNSEEIRAIKKYTKNSGDPADDKFYARLNAMLRGEIPEDAALRYYSDLISGALRKNQLKHDIVCYRTVPYDIYRDFLEGDVFSEQQFISSSVTASGTLVNPFTVTIFCPKGTPGAYIETLSKFPKQREFLIDKNAWYKVLKKSNDHIELEVLVK